MKRRTVIKGLASAGMTSLCLAKSSNASLLNSIPGSPVLAGSFQPTWQSLMQYATPKWFRDAKFGMWAHWGPQSMGEDGDWYARRLYFEGDRAYVKHCQRFGHPSKVGFKDVIHLWKAEKWDPEELVSFYKRAGARYFMALANHHDNFDLYDSTYQPWNSTKIGPKKDIARGWANAASKHGLPLGLSVHASHAWSWFEPSQRADKQGPLVGVPYDGKLKAEDGKGAWWEGLDSQELYAQNHPLSKNSDNNQMIHQQWNWGNGVFPPSQAYCEKFYKRTIELVDKYQPEVLYFDDTALPFCQINDVGLKIAAHMYNASTSRHGELRAVICAKILDEMQRKCMVWDVERGSSNKIEPLPWQTDTCLGDWFYSNEIYERGRYKSAQTVIHMLADIVSKNGNLMLNVPVRADGTIDEKERAIVETIGAWMLVNGEAIYGTRPWNQLGEGPAMQSAAPLRAQGFNEGRVYGPADIRFTQKGKVLYAIVLGWPTEKQILVKSLPDGNSRVERVGILGGVERLNFEQSAAGLKVYLPAAPPCKEAFALKIDGVVA
jgi:alpha-L-fucosidase